jgi:hypothetical protein
LQKACPEVFAKRATETIFEFAKATARKKNNVLREKLIFKPPTVK